MTQPLRRCKGMRTWLRRTEIGTGGSCPNTIRIIFRNTKRLMKYPNYSSIRYCSYRRNHLHRVSKSMILRIVRISINQYVNKQLNKS